MRRQESLESLDVCEREIERRAERLQQEYVITSKPHHQCNSVLWTCIVKTDQVLILKCGEEYSVRAEKIINLMVDKGSLEEWKPVHVCSIPWELNPNKVFWKLKTTDPGHDFYALYLGNQQTLKYHVLEDILVFMPATLPPSRPGWPRNQIDYLAGREEETSQGRTTPEATEREGETEEKESVESGVVVVSGGARFGSWADETGTQDGSSSSSHSPGAGRSPARAPSPLPTNQRVGVRWNQPVAFGWDQRPGGFTKARRARQRKYKYSRGERGGKGARGAGSQQRNTHNQVRHKNPAGPAPDDEEPGASQNNVK